MNADPVDPALRSGGAAAALVRWLNASAIALCALLLLWELWLAPLRPGGSWLALKALPLALAIPGLLRGTRYTRQWLSLLLPFYLAEGIVRAFSEPGRVRMLALAEILLAGVAFAAIMLILRRRKAAPHVRDVRGFSLIELLAGIVIFSVLALVAYPSYINYKVRANRAAAQTLLIDLANRQQLHVLDARAFAATLAELNAVIPPEVSTYYTVADPVVDNAATPPTFIFSATARPGTMQARDGDLSINSAGVRAGHW